MLKSLKTALFTVPFFTIAFTTFGQTKSETAEEIPYIEVTGTAEKEIIPDEIYMGITLREKYEGKTKVTIEEQEEKLKGIFKSLNLGVSNLTLTDADADYVKVRWQKKDILTRKDYQLKVGDAATVGKVFQELDKIEITDAFISRVSHTKIDSLKKAVKIMAIKDAKNKADYLLGAIGEQAKKPLIIRETEFPTTNAAGVYGVNVKGSRSEGMQYYVNGVKQLSSPEPEIQFQKIKIQSNIYMKYSIK